MGKDYRVNSLYSEIDEKKHNFYILKNIKYYSIIQFVINL